jgi:uncharacterized RDD family membrane protein YckC
MSAIPTITSLVPAEIPARLAARIIDTLIVSAVAGSLGMRIGFGFDWLLTSALAILFYFACCDAFAGATLGKLVMGLRVIGPDGNRPTLKESLIREAFTLLGAVPFAGPLLALVAWVWIFVTMRSSPLRQGKHDLLAGGTGVVRRNPLVP